MSWRQNMGAGLKNEPFETYAQKPQKEQKAEKDAFATIALIAPKVQKVKTPEIIIKKMSNCFHSKPCRFISLVDDRQVCRKNNQAIFDMTVCPDGKWELFKDKPKPQKKTMTCYCCGGQSFWRNTNNRGGRFICSECHPPILSRGEIEWL